MYTTLHREWKLQVSSSSSNTRTITATHLKQNSDTEIHERLGEIYHALPSVIDRHRRNSQVRSLWAKGKFLAWKRRVLCLVLHVSSNTTRPKVQMKILEIKIHWTIPHRYCLWLQLKTKILICIILGIIFFSSSKKRESAGVVCRSTKIIDKDSPGKCSPRQTFALQNSECIFYKQTRTWYSEVTGDDVLPSRRSTYRPAGF